VALIGKPREPITPAAGVLVTVLISIGIILWL
jgi:hypothetical protein